MSNYKDLSDIDIMRKVSAYDSRAIEELYNRYSPLLYTLIKKIAPDEKTSEDLLIEIFTIIWKKSDKFDFESGNVFTWLITLARNRAVDHVRRTRAGGEKIDKYDDDYENYFILPTLSKKIEKIDYETALSFRSNMESALARLTDAQKYVIHLAYYEGYNLEEIADKLNIPVETVRAKIMTALKNLQEQLA